jgi:replicative DNA helicase
LRLIDEIKLPHDLFYETVVLGSIARIGTLEYFERVAKILGKHAFYGLRNRLVFDAMQALYQRSEEITIPTVYHELQKNGSMEAVSDCGGMLEIFEAAELEDIEGYAEQLSDLARRREIITKCTKIAESGMRGDQLQELETDLHRLTEKLIEQKNGKRAITLIQIAEELGGVNAIFSHKSAPTALLTPFDRFNEKTGGLGAGELFVVGGRPGTGKSAFAGNIALHGALSGKKVRFHSLEMKRDKLFYRFLSQIAEVDSRRIKARQFDAFERDRSLEALGKIYEEGLGNKLEIDDDPDISLASLSATLRAAEALGDPYQLLIVDYLLLMKSVGSRTSRREELVEITQGLKRLANRHNTAIMLLSQIGRDYEKRSGENKSARPELRDFKETGSIEEDADSAMILTLEKPQDAFNPIRNVDGWLLKHREGATGIFGFVFHAPYTKFVERGKDVDQA